MIEWSFAKAMTDKGPAWSDRLKGQDEEETETDGGCDDDGDADEPRESQAGAPPPQTSQPPRESRNGKLCCPR